MLRHQCPTIALVRRIDRFSEYRVSRKRKVDVCKIVPQVYSLTTLEFDGDRYASRTGAYIASEKWLVGHNNEGFGRRKSFMWTRLLLKPRRT